MKRTTFPWLVIKRDISLESVGSGRCLISPVLWRGKLCLTWTPWSCKGTPGQIKVYIKYLLNNIEWEVHNLNVSVSSVTASTESHCPCWWVLWHSDISLIPEAHCINSYPTLFKQLLCMGETHSSFRFSMNESVTFSLFSQKLQQEAIRKRQVQTVKWTGFRRRLLITRFSLQTNAWFTQISTSKDDIKSSYSLEYFVWFSIASQTSGGSDSVQLGDGFFTVSLTIPSCFSSTSTSWVVTAAPPNMNKNMMTISS